MLDTSASSSLVLLRATSYEVVVYWAAPVWRARNASKVIESLPGWLQQIVCAVYFFFFG